MTHLKPLETKKKLKLADYDPADTDGSSKEEAAVKIALLENKLASLQELLYASQCNSVLIVLQGTDTSGKDGTIRHVMRSVNPQGCSVASFKVPTPDEAAHDFLWRSHAKVPAKGMITIFNRSYYEDVIVTRVHDTIDKDECESRYKIINSFESSLIDQGTIIVKLFLHISQEEQKERLEEREKDPTKAWKLSAGDWHERTFWKQYQEAYETALSATSHKDAPWYMVPADKKWFRDVAIAELLVKTLEKHEGKWNEVLKEMGKSKLAEVKKVRGKR